MNMPWLQKSSVAIGVLMGIAATAVVVALPDVNWQSIAAPVDTRPLTIRHDGRGDGRFGAPRSGGRRHVGVDLVAPLGSPVRAIQRGVVIQVGAHRGLGNFVEVEHRKQLHSLYSHLDEVQVVLGQRVRQGQVIGTVGKTGNAKSPEITPHLHFEVLRQTKPFDPRTLGLRAVDSGPLVAQSPDLAAAQNNAPEAPDAGGE